MQINMLREWFWGRGMLAKGEAYSLPDEQAQQLVNQGVAVRMFDKTDDAPRKAKRGRERQEA